MKIREIKAKSILTKSGLSTDFSLNPYVGCSHKCVYCYARFMKRFRNYPEEWGEFVDVKINAPEILEKEIKKLSPSPKLFSHSKRKPSIFISSVSDPYQPLEKKYKLTRKCLEILSKYNFSVFLLTKSSLVFRDLDLFKKFKDLEIGTTITVLDDKIQKLFEPYSSSSSERIRTLEKLHKAGIKTCAFIGPILPFITNLPELFKVLKDKIDGVSFDSLNTKGKNFDGVTKILKKHFPELLIKYKKILFPYDTNYWESLRKEILDLSRKYNMPVEVYFK